MGSEVAMITELNVDVHEPTFVKPAEPCSDTSPLELSNIDQCLAFTVETIYFYGAHPDKSNDQVAEVLKDALSKVMVEYDFLAGRLNLSETTMRLEISRNYAGAQFGTASCDLTIAELGDITIPNPVFRKLVPQAYKASKISDIPLMMVQVTTFKCGGFTIGFGMSHLVWDGLGVIEFLANLTSLSKGGPIVCHPKPDRSMLKARSPPTPKYDHPEYLKLDEAASVAGGAFTTPDAAKSDFEGLSASKKHVTKVFPFTGVELAALKARATEDGILSKASSFDALCGHVWKARTKSLDMEPTELATLLYAVDIRARLEPNLPEHFCGNGVYSACARATSQQLAEKPLSFAVQKIKEANDRLTNDYLRSALDWWEVYRGVPAIPNGIFISSWWKMPFYAVDFGWGKPLFAGPAVSPLVEFVLFVPNGKTDGGLNMIISLEPHVMAKFEANIKVSV